MPFRDLAGHRGVHTLLARGVGRGALPHSLLFAGPEGVGKRLTAIALAQLLNCPQPVRADAADGEPYLDACGTCSSCRRIAGLTHPDVVLVAGGASVDEIRDVLRSAAFRPFEGRWRVFILDDADTLSAVVQNALLKTLEEPGATAQFIIVSSRPDVLLPTVRSRCPMLRFGRLPIDLVARLVAEQTGSDAALAREAAFAADGSPGRALHDVSEMGAANRALAEHIVCEVVKAGPAKRLQLATLLMSPGESKARGRSRNTKTASERELLADRMDVLAATLRDLGVAAASANEAWMSRAPSAALAAASRALDATRLAHAFDATERARHALERNVSPKLVADWLLMQV
jgi:DNA polymerase-3 subunit delta'